MHRFPLWNKLELSNENFARVVDDKLCFRIRSELRCPKIEDSRVHQHTFGHP